MATERFVGPKKGPRDRGYLLYPFVAFGSTVLRLKMSALNASALPQASGLDNFWGCCEQVPSSRETGVGVSTCSLIVSLSNARLQESPELQGCVGTSRTSGCYSIALDLVLWLGSHVSQAVPWADPFLQPQILCSLSCSYLLVTLFRLLSKNQCP